MPMTAVPTQEQLDDARRTVTPMVDALVTVIEARNLDSRAELIERLVDTYARQELEIGRLNDVIGRLALDRQSSKGGDGTKAKAA